DAETQRFAQLKGLSLDWFEAEPVELAGTSSAAIAVATPPRGAVADGHANGRTADALGPPGWIGRNERLAPILAGPWPTRIARGLIGVVLGFSIFYSVAYVNMYASISTPVRGSEWLYQNAARGSVIATEHWEEGMP